VFQSEVAYLGVGVTLQGSQIIQKWALQPKSK
jgi:hypothetical protein